MEAQIGEAAGRIWKTLHTKGALAKPQIAKETGLSTELMNQGLGWLAREGKITTDKGKGGPVLKLKA